MNIHELNTRKTPIVRIDKSLDQFDGKILFPEKLKEANKVLKKASLPGQDSEKWRSEIWSSLIKNLKGKWNKKDIHQSQILTTLMVLRCVEENENQSFKDIYQKCNLNFKSTQHYLDILNQSNCISIRKERNKLLYSTTSELYVNLFYTEVLSKLKELNETHVDKIEVESSVK